MLGPAKLRCLDQPIAVSREDLVPQDNIYRFKLQLIMFFEGVRSERQLIATTSLNLAHR
jgi:hypothetical protein